MAKLRRHVVGARGSSVPKKRRNRRRKNWNGIVRPLAIVALFCEIVWALFFNPYLQISMIQVEGNQLLSVGTVVKDAHVGTRENIFIAWLKDPIVARVDRDPIVDHASETIRLPSTLVVHVIERQPYALMQASDTNFVLDKNQIPFRTVEALIPGVPVLQFEGGTLPHQIIMGRPIKAYWLSKTYELMALLADKNNLRVKTIKVDQNANLCLNRVDNLQIKLGDPDLLPLKVAIAEATVKADGGDIARRAEYIDVSSPEQPVWKPRADAAGGKNKNGTVYGRLTGR